MRACSILALAARALLALPTAASLHIDKFARLDEALPLSVNISSIYPVFDFDQGSCYPSAAISREGKLNSGIDVGGFSDHSGACRNQFFMDMSNTYHRYACTTVESDMFCAHAFALYMMMDQRTSLFASGHRHDWSTAMIWTKNDEMTFGSYFALGTMHTIPAAEVPTQDGHPKFVYHLKGFKDNQFRFAKTDESAENSYRKFVTPLIASWFTMKGDDVPNAKLRELLTSYDYDRVRLPLGDTQFLSMINESPEGFPEFSSWSAAKSF